MGVTNIILKEDFDGLQLSGRMRIPEQLGGGGGYDFDIVGGGNFGGGRGNAVFALTYTKTDRLDGQDRDFSRGLRVSQFRTNRLDTGLNDGIPDRIVVRDVVRCRCAGRGSQLGTCVGKGRLGGVTERRLTSTFLSSRLITLFDMF